MLWLFFLLRFGCNHLLLKHVSVISGLINFFKWMFTHVVDRRDWYVVHSVVVLLIGIFIQGRLRKYGLRYPPGLIATLGWVKELKYGSCWCICSFLFFFFGLLRFVCKGCKGIIILLVVNCLYTFRLIKKLKRRALQKGHWVKLRCIWLSGNHFLIGISRH